jgi:hypothetical protein
MDKCERVKMVKAMEFICRQINDEDVFEGWLLCGVADGEVQYADLDGHDKDGILDYYVEDGNFADLMHTFLRVMARARKSGGLYCDGIVDKEEVLK